MKFLAQLFSLIDQRDSPADQRARDAAVQRVLAMIATAERPLGTGGHAADVLVERTVVRGGGTSLGSLGFTTTWVEGPG